MSGSKPGLTGGWRNRLRNYWLLVRADRPIGIYLLLWPALWALWVAAEGIPPWQILLVFVGGTVLMRSAGCAINDYADRGFDGRVRRTAQRPLATGAVSPAEALAVFAVLSLMAFALVLMLNKLTIAYSVVAVLLAAIYPFTKRFMDMPQLVLGAAFGWAVPMAFTAVQSQVPPVAWVLFVATVVWALIYDTMYAMADREDDLRIGVRSSAILFGDRDRVVIAGLQLLMLGLLWQVSRMADLGVWFWLAMGVAAGLFAYQHWLIRDREHAACISAFLNNHYVGMTLFLGLALDYAIGGRI